MHILIPVLHRPHKPTGVCRHAANLAECLTDTEKIQKITLVTGKWQANYFKTNFNLNSPKINLVEIDIKNNSFSRNTWFLVGLPKLANKLNPDLIHLSFPFPFIRQWFTCPVVATIHDLYPYECPENFGFPQVWFNRLFLSQCISNADGLTCVSEVTLESLKTYFEKTIANKQTSVVYNYVEFDSTEPKPPEAISFSEDYGFLLTVAQHRKNKNLDLLINAYNVLLENKTLTNQSKLIIVGSSGPETQNILNLIKSLSLQEQVILLSAIDDNQLCWLYKFCQLFVIPSSTEGFCLPLVEALSLKSKVLCTDIPIFKEVCSNSNCLYFSLNSNSIENLAEMINLAIKQPQEVIDTTSWQFSKQIVAQKYMDFYKKLDLQKQFI